MNIIRDTSFPNKTKWWFRGGIIACSALMLGTSILYFVRAKKHGWPSQKHKWNIRYAIATLICAIGIFAVAFPADKTNPFYWIVHIIGTILFFFIYIFLNFFWQMKRIFKKLDPSIPSFWKRLAAAWNAIASKDVDFVIDIIWATIIIITGFAFLVIYVLGAVGVVPIAAPVISEKVAMIEVIISAFILDVKDM